MLRHHDYDPGSITFDDNENTPRGRPGWTEVPRRSSRRRDSGIAGISQSMSIPLGQLKRRQSRDNASESVDGDSSVYHAKEQEAPLLDPDSDSGRETPVLHEAARRVEKVRAAIHTSFHVQGVILFLAAAAIFFIALSFLALAVVTPERFPPPTIDPLGIKLHPEDHRFRHSKNQTFYWEITSAYRAPDGVEKKVYLINGQFPGPLIECRTGDRLIVHVTNKLEDPKEKISIHWHGISMRGANAMDGAVGFTQCPIQINKTFTYDFEINDDSFGTFWYHAHSDVHRGDGMYGGLIVHDARELFDPRVPKSDQEVLLLIGDWYHRNASEVLSWYMSVRGFKNEVGSAFIFVLINFW